ncbi:MAG: KTSC domain-containing protein [Candidatus Paceibacterota bacterium]|jgi:hypothetical protein
MAISNLLKILLGQSGDVKTNKLAQAEQEIAIAEVVPVDSSWVSSVQYNEPTKSLRIKLDDGSAYTYYNVPESLYQRIITASSVGKIINSVIKTGFYPFVRS